MFNPTKYKLLNVSSGDVFDDNGWSLSYPDSPTPSLIRAIYESKKLTIRDNELGLYKFGDWLPMHRHLTCDAAPVTFRSEGLASALELKNLWITFNGYFPKVGANMTTCSFKETEAYSVCARATNNDRVLVVSSAGNTARAFAKVCSDNGIKLLLCVPEDNLDALWFEKELNPCVKLICACKGGDYFDAIHLGDIAVRSQMFYAEGGAKNVARRDGMGTTVLSAVTTIGHIPDYYFQAVGSGTGAIAAWEACMRLKEDGRFGDNMLKLIVSQNDPFLPMYDAFMSDSRELPYYDPQKARADVEMIDAKVLSNRKPPYSVVGGLYDALKATNGAVLKSTNADARTAADLFERLEGVDIHPAAAVATASLIRATKDGLVDKKATIMLNITGGGQKLFQQGKKLWYLKPSYIFGLEPDENEVISKAESLFR
ncbi:MAG: cysteate synthase [Alistipes sp.]|nr:cysteate synthase [Candidatus Alistipes equi]